MKLKFILPVLFAIVSVLFFSCKSKTEGNGAIAPTSEVKDYAVLTLSPRKAKVNFDFPATIQGQQVIEIRPKVDGYVDAIYVKVNFTI